METLTDDGRAWAEANGGMVASVALQGYESSWPTTFIDTAITTCNEQAEALIEAVYGPEREEPCVHGHFDCARYKRGPCANEEYARELGRVRPLTSL
jgi:hypothetical protein